MTIDGTTEPGSGGHPVIQIDGTEAGPAVGLDLTSSASGSVLKGLVITDFADGGVLLNGAANVTITGADIGLTYSFSGPTAHGNGPFGVELENGANHDVLTSDVISGNGQSSVNFGVELSGPGTNDNVIQGDFFGTDGTGQYGVYNGEGVLIADGATNNTIGGTVAGSADIISGNITNGVEISGAGTTGNVVEGDDIGTNGVGQNSLPNAADGVAIGNGARQTPSAGRRPEPATSSRATGCTVWRSMPAHPATPLSVTISARTCPARTHSAMPMACRSSRAKTRLGARPRRPATSSRATQARASSLPARTRWATWSRETTSAPTFPARTPWVTIGGVFIESGAANNSDRWDDHRRPRHHLSQLFRRRPDR